MRLRSGLDMAEERERGEGAAGRRGDGQAEETERNQERSKWSNGPIMLPNDPAPNALKTALPMTIHAASASSDADCQAPINRFKLSAASCTESRYIPMEEHLDVFRQKPVRVSVKVNVPVAEHPKVSVFCFNPYLG